LSLICVFPIIIILRRRRRWRRNRLNNFIINCRPSQKQFYYNLLYTCFYSVSSPSPSFSLPLYLLCPIRAASKWKKKVFISFKKTCNNNNRPIECTWLHYQEHSEKKKFVANLNFFEKRTFINFKTYIHLHAFCHIINRGTESYAVFAIHKIFWECLAQLFNAIRALNCIQY